MAKIEITRTELVWPGKYDEDGSLKAVPRMNLPLQVIEWIGRNRVPLSGAPEIQEGDPFEEGWRNQLIRGDNLLVMGSLLERFAGKIDLIYIDPPFATGMDFSFATEIGDSTEKRFRTQSRIEAKAYRDIWDERVEPYLTMMAQRLRLIRRLLSPAGSLYVHVDAKISPYMRLLLTEIMGADAFRNEIYWYYTNKIPDTRKRLFTRSTDTILFYALGANHFEYQEEKRDVPIKVSRMKKIAGKKIYLRGGDGKVEMIERNTRVVDNVWRIAMLHAQPEMTGYPTQKPQPLLERIISASSRQGDLIADFFCGSGTTLAAAGKLGRRWIGCDLGRWAVHLTRKRLLDLEHCKPFEVLDLGKYERQYWQGATFGRRASCQYPAFILELYGARPVAGMACLHGQRGQAMVHIGAVDAPVSIETVGAAVEECARSRRKELHVLGWEWEMGVCELVPEAAAKGVKLLLLQIPREVMEPQAARGGVRFFELARLKVEIGTPEKLTAQVALEAFVIPHPELLPGEVRSKVEKWSDYIDYWAVDWDFRGHTFRQGWVAYRTRKQRRLPLVSDPHTYGQPGRYCILVRVIDIFGNHTSQLYHEEMS